MAAPLSLVQVEALLVCMVARINRRNLRGAATALYSEAMQLHCLFCPTSVSDSVST